MQIYNKEEISRVFKESKYCQITPVSLSPF